VKVTDFGIAKARGVLEPTGVEDTRARQLKGKFGYMSPEHVEGEAVDARSDLFSLGVVLYEAVAGKRPFEGESVTETMMNIIMQEPLELSAVAPKAPAHLVEVVSRALQKKPERRFGSAGEMVDALSKADLKPTPPKAPQRPQKIDAPTVTMPSAPQTSAAPIAGQRALIADDDPVTRYLIANILGQRRITFDEAGNGADAVKQLKAHEYTLIFLDLLMPRIDGWGVIDWLRRSKSKVPRIFVITGVKDQTHSIADRELVSGLIYKPLDPNEVDRVVQQSLSGVTA